MPMEINSLGNLRITKEKFEEYFYSRPIESQIGALVSKQSSKLSTYNDIIKEFKINITKYPILLLQVAIQLAEKPRLDYWALLFLAV